MSEMLIKESTLQELGDLVRASKGVGDKIPVTELRDELAGLIGTASIGRPRPTHSINFARYSENPTADFALSTTLKNNISWSDKTDSGYITFTAHGSDPYVVIGGTSASSPLCDKTADQLAYIVIKYRVNSPITDAKAYGEFYTSRSDGVQWGSVYGNHIDWEWVCDGEWHLALIDARYIWGSANNVYLHSFRLDALAAGTNPDDADFSGFTIDIEYINFFAEKYYAEVFVQTEKYVSSAVDGAIVDGSFVYNKNERYYTGSENVSLRTYVPWSQIEGAGIAPQTSADGITAMSGGSEIVLCTELGTKYLAENGGIKDEKGNYSQITFKGWVNPAATGLTITAFAYRITDGRANIDHESADWVVYDEELSTILGSPTARRHSITVDTSAMVDGIYNISFYVRLSDGNIYWMSTWGSAYYRKKTDYVDNAGNAYRVASNKVYKNGVVIDAIKATPYYSSDDSHAYIAYNPQIEVFQKIKGYNGEFVYPDDIVIKTDEPVVRTDEDGEIVSLTVTENGVYYPKDGESGFAPVTVEIPIQEPVTEVLTVTANGTYTPAEGVDGFTQVDVNVPTPEPVTESLTITENGVYAPPEGVDGYSHIEVEVASSSEEFIQTVDRSITELTADDLSGITSIGYSAFSQCLQLKSVVIPDSVTSISGYAFSNCNGLTSIVIPDSVTSIGNYAFTYCQGLRSAVIGGGVRSLGYCVFSNCTKLSDVTIRSGVTEIGASAFNYCTELKTISLPDTIITIGQLAFNSCNKISDIYYAGSKEEWLEINIDASNSSFLNRATIHYGKPSEPIGCEGLDYVSNGDGTCYVAGRGACTHSEVVIPEISPAGDTVVAIGNSAFKDNMQLYEVTIPGTVVTIGEYAFNGCKFLHNVVLGEGAQSIGDYAFGGCGADLNSEEFPYFEINFPDSLTAIGEGAFSSAKLQTINIPKEVAVIGSMAFRYCNLDGIQVDANNAVYYSEGNCLIESDTKTVIAGCNLSSLPSDGTVVQIGDYAFCGRTGLTNITIPDSVTSIGKHAFYGCTGLTSATIGNSVTNIGDEVFARCASLTTVIFNSGVTPIVFGMFESCASLTSITILDGVTSIEDTAFSGCENLTNITIPESVTYIGVVVFDSCTNLTDVYYAASIDEWSKITIEDGNDAFLNANIHFAIEKPTTIFYAKDLLTTVNAGMDLDAVVTDNNYITYTYITYTPGSSDPYYYPFKNVLGNRYLSINFRTTTATGAYLQFYIGSSGGGPQNDDTMMKTQIVPAAADGNWHTVVFDLQPLINAGHYNGKDISYFRFDVLDAQGGAMPAGASIDIKYIAFFETETGANQPEEKFFEPNSTETFVAPISKSFKYCAHVDTINFNGYGLGDGYRDDSSGSSVIVTPVIDNYGAGNLNVDDVVGDEAVLVLSGWALVNGGQDKYFWSLDGNTWTEVAKGMYGLANDAQVNAARAKGVDAAVHANGTFKDVVIDLSAYRGQTLPTLYVAVRSTTAVGTPAVQRMCHFLTFTNCHIPG